MKSFPNLVRKTLAAVALAVSVNVISLRAEVIYWPLTGLDVARQRATSLNCVSNPRRIALGAREWSAYHVDQVPLGFQVFTSELESPAVFSCPANLAHTASTNWAGFDFDQSDYEWVLEDEPTGKLCDDNPRR